MVVVQDCRKVAILMNKLESNSIKVQRYVLISWLQQRSLFPSAMQSWSFFFLPGGPRGDLENEL